MEFVSSELSGADFVASDWTDTALFTSEFLACLSARLSTVEVCVSDLYCRVRPSYGGESRLHERDQLYGHGVKVSQSKLRRLRAKRVRYRLWSTARGPDPSWLVRAGICAPRYYRNFCSDDSEEEEWVEDTCGTQADMDAVELAGNSLCSQCSDSGTQTNPRVHIACGTQTDLCVLFVGEEEKEECHRVSADNNKNSEVVSVSVDPGVLKEELHDEELQGEELQNEELRNVQLHCSHHRDSMASHPGSSTTGRLSNAVVSAAVTEDECQAARDWALAGVDVSALWRELHRLPTQEFQRRTEALNAYRLQLGIESSEEDDSQQGVPQSSTSRSALTRSGEKHRKRHR
ncbi:unnamed protein product [Prorocentrum cordatum]|uniref:Uncharacterized protein n=1 Tax=Prorocentrum cordatum TaxID=2364126 RepID=A0ABN9WR94_9DINO|nr:unnamed protein product [Polarella glacialis]